MTTRSRRSLIQLVSVVASFTSLDITSAEVAPWRMKDGKVMDLELRDAWGEDDAAMVEFLTRGMKIVTLKRNELHPEDQKKIPAPQPGHEDFRFAWATARPAAGEKGEVTITYKFARTLPGVIGCDEGTLKVAPFKIGNVAIAPGAWKVVSTGGVMEFRATGPYDATKLVGAKFSASLEVEVGKDLRRMIQRIEFPGRPLQQIKSRFGDFEITSVYGPALGEIPARYGVLVRSEPKEKLIKFLTESNGRTAGLGGIEVSVAGTFATVKIDYWDSFEKKVIQFSGTAGQPGIR